MPPYTADPVVAGPGWAIRRVGPCVLGYWAAPLTEERVNACADLYRRAREAHGRFAVFAVFTTTPFHLETLLEARARNAIVSLVNEFAADFVAVTSVFEMPRGFKSSIARTSAAAVTRVASRHIPFIFADSRKEAYALARARGALDVVNENAHEREIGELKRSAENVSNAS